MDNIKKGRVGEGVARKYLLDKGYRILESNYRNRIGEIDIIAFYRGVLVFVEVKTRTNTNFGYAYEAVNRKKQLKIINTSMIYVKSKGYGNIQLRYDIIEVYLTGKSEINHIENAFCL
ncbi:MAG: YraN family protein [Tissierellaceae bacterium]|jgi:putative endonuclease